MSDLDKIIFGKKTFSDLLEEIYNNQKKKSDQITSLIKELQPLVKDVGDATLIVPLLKEYLDIGVKNDEQLIKLAQIVQRITQTASKDSNGDFVISEEEKEALRKQIEEVGKIKENE